MTRSLQQAATIVAFLSLSAAGFYTVSSQFFVNGAYEEVSGRICPRPPTYEFREQRQYTGLASIDNILCSQVILFHTSLSPQHFLYMTHFLSGTPPVFLAYLIEGARTDSLQSVQPVLMGLLQQFLGGACIMPLAWLALLLSSSGRPDRGCKPLTRIQAEAVSCGIMLGYICTTIAMLYARNERITACWQIFAVYVWALQRAWLVLRRRSRRVAESAPGFPVVRAALLTTAVLSSLPHFVAIHHSYPRTAEQFLAWWPSFSAPDPRAPTDLQSAVYHLMRWDSIVWYTSAILAVSLLAESRCETLRMLAAAPLASLLLSPGAVIALYWLRRESQLAGRQGEQMRFAGKKTT